MPRVGHPCPSGQKCIHMVICSRFVSMLQGFDLWTLLMTTSRHFLLTVFRVGGGVVYVLVAVCINGVSSLGTLSV